MRRARAAVLLVLASFVALVPAFAVRGEEPRDLHVVLVSIDGLRPEFYSSDEYDTPTLKALAATGARAKGVEPVYPSVTYPGHASIVTGVRPAKHGILANTRWDDHGARPEWFWETKDLKARTIWQAAREKGRKVAITEWPSSVGADVDWLIPERWALPGETTQDLLVKHSTKGLLFEIALALGVNDLKPDWSDFSKLDEFISKAAAYVLKVRKPDLLLVHLAQVDHEEHQVGRDGPSVQRAVHLQDQNIARIRKAAEDGGILERTVFVVTGDHGFTDVTKTVAPNVALARAGLVDTSNGRVTGYRALAHAHGGSAAIYAKDAESSEKAHAALEQESVKDGKRLFTIIERAQLDALGANPTAAFFLEAEDQVGFSGSLAGGLVTEEPKHGTHGGLPTKPQLRTGFVASGPGVRHTTLESLRLIDIAPLIAKLLDLDLPDAEGGVPDVLTAEPD